MSASWEQSFDGGTPGRTPDGLEQRFDATSLVSLRSAVAAHGGALGLSPTQVNDLVLVAHELASNSVRHGGGGGRLRLWRIDGSVYCEVSDVGVGFPFSRPERLPDLSAPGGRGLWMIVRLADEVSVESNDNGTTARVEIRVSPQ
jgi:anti-sigma regulatory factor (Ser/Thr protein kinase)